MIYILAHPISIRKVYKDLRCSSAIVIDDLINGNVSSDYKTFFVGVEPAKKTFV